MKRHASLEALLSDPSAIDDALRNGLSGREGTDLRRAHLLEQFALRIFKGDYGRAMAAMSGRQPRLGGLSPRELAKTTEGMQRVRALIDELEPVRPRGPGFFFAAVEEGWRREFEPLVDLLQAAWGLGDEEFEQLLGAPPTWLRAWRNHEAQIDETVRERLKRLRRFHEAMRLVTTPSDYARMWRRAWRSESPIGQRSPWQAFLEGGEEALNTMETYFRAQGR